jgi:hypothetical protein
MKKKSVDRHLDVPAEANRDKHINFAALENRETDPADEPAKGKLAPGKQTDESGKRSRKEAKKNKRRHNEVDSSNAADYIIVFEK